MKQIETFGKSIYKFLILSGILAQINLGLAVTGIIIILTAGKEIVALLIVVLIQNGHLKLCSKLPTLLIVTVSRM